MDGFLIDCMAELLLDVTDVGLDDYFAQIFVLVYVE